MFKRLTLSIFMFVHGCKAKNDAIFVQEPPAAAEQPSSDIAKPDEAQARPVNGFILLRGGIGGGTKSQVQANSQKKLRQIDLEPI
jgi:hypothetical protein